MKATAGIDYTSLMVVAAAREIRDGEVCFIGVGVPSQAAMVAVKSRAPHAFLLYESGAIGTTPSRPPLSVADEDLVRQAVCLVSVAEVFNYWLQGELVDVGLVGVAQVDRHGNVNSTVVGAYERPRTRLPGAGGAPTIAGFARRTVVLAKHTPATLVDRVDFVTTPGALGRGEERTAAGLPGAGVTTVVTDKAVLRADPAAGESGESELVLSAYHPGVSLDEIEAGTGWPLRYADQVTETAASWPREHRPRLGRAKQSRLRSLQPKPEGRDDRRFPAGL